MERFHNELEWHYIFREISLGNLLCIVCSIDLRLKKSRNNAKEEGFPKKSSKKNEKKTESKKEIQTQTKSSKITLFQTNGSKNCIENCITWTTQVLPSSSQELSIANVKPSSLYYYTLFIFGKRFVCVALVFVVDLWMCHLPTHQ